MTPEEKAVELFNKMYQVDDILYERTMDQYQAKHCALIAVDEIINSEPRHLSNVDWDDCGATHQYYYEAQMEEALNYWQQVKKEIINL